MGVYNLIEISIDIYADYSLPELIPPSALASDYNT